VIRNAVIHIANEQPLLADVYSVPTAGDVSLVCTNVRMLDGKKPIFVDHSDSVFVFPYQTIRFIEMMPGSVEGFATAPNDGAAAAGRATEPGSEPQPDEAEEADLELDEDFLRRIREV
jgi:hypothetical protein